MAEYKDLLRQINTNTKIDGRYKIGNTMANANHYKEYSKTIKLWELWKKTQIEELTDAMLALVMSAYSRLDQYTEMADILENSQRLYAMRPTVRMYNILIEAWASKGVYEEAEQAFQQMDSSGSKKGNVVTYTTMINMYKKLKNVKKAECLCYPFLF